ncbi:helix-turn-helix domain-containing protein [Kribbella sp. CA-293567]|uniref:helix-turn-helix domain-containing protein n=1 Tax=Kribbella sp. CA-293567 TaxID=3002436 RepID=UPI0022DE4EB6|nr:helix-turn-helix domain-containing protein [Kribbella sp. CA-293567]WBQ02975.1 helix-turn-helix domain-containing protein [Kribbella sp. CA-293567]
MSVGDWARLGARVAAERARQGHSAASFGAAAGLSSTTVDSIEHHRKESYDPGTLAQLEQALGWQPGSVKRVLAGLEPKPVEDPDLAAVIDAWPRLSPGARRMLRVLATEGAEASWFE